MTIPFKMAVLVPFSVLMHEVPFHESSQQQGKIAKIHAQIVDVHMYFVHNRGNPAPCLQMYTIWKPTSP